MEPLGRGRVRRGARICGDQRGKCGLGTAAETRVRGARRTGCPGGGSRAAARPGGWRPEPAPAGGRAERSPARGQGGRRPRAARSPQNLRGRSARPSASRAVTARVSSPTRLAHLGSPLAAARQAAPALHLPVQPPAAALLQRLLLFVPHCTALPPRPGSDVTAGRTRGIPTVAMSVKGKA